MLRQLVEINYVIFCVSNRFIKVSAECLGRLFMVISWEEMVGNEGINALDILPRTA